MEPADTALLVPYVRTSPACLWRCTVTACRCSLDPRRVNTSSLHRQPQPALPDVTSCCRGPPRGAQAVLSDLLLNLQRMLDRHDRCIRLVALGAGPTGRWPVLYANHAWTGLTGG
jgi:hypothetical protein